MSLLTFEQLNFLDMKFRWPILMGLIFCATGLNSQVLISLLLGDKLNSGGIEFGLEGGYSLSGLTGVDPSEGHSDFNLGFYFDIRMKNPSWFLSTGVRVKSTMGANGLSTYDLGDEDLNNAFEGGSVNRVLGYFQVPVSLRYRFNNNLFAQAGVQLGLRNGAKDVFVNTINKKDDLEYSLNVKSKYHPLDAGLLGGIGYRFIKGNGMNLSVQYYLGLVDVRISDATPDQKNNALYVNLGIPIGKGKAAKAQAEKNSNE